MSERFSDWLAAQLEETGIDMAELSRRSGVSTAYLSMLRNGTRSNPTPEKLLSIKSALAGEATYAGFRSSTSAAETDWESHPFRLAGLDVNVLMKSAPASVQIHVTGGIRAKKGLELTGEQGASIRVHGEPTSVRCQVVNREGEDILLIECPLGRLRAPLDVHHA